MKILVLTTSYPSGPADAGGVFIQNLVCALARRGHAMRVVAPAGKGVAGRCVIEGIPVWRFRYGTIGRSLYLTSVPGGIPEALRRRPTAALGLGGLMARFVKAAREHVSWADLIYANWLGAGLAGRGADKHRKVPMVITLRGDDAYLLHKRWLWRAIGRCVFRRCAAVTAVSANMAPLIEPHLPERLRPVLVPAFGVDIGQFHPPTGTQREAGTGPAGLFVGNVARAKGVDVLIRALAKCDDAWRRFAFVGGGPDVEKMKRLARELNVDGRIEWAGPRPATETPDWMRRFDFLVLPSLSEGRPNVVVEAMASGLPVIATSVGGVPELVSDGRTGLLVKAGDAQELADVIRNLCTNAALRGSLGRAGRAYVEAEDLTWDRTAGQMEEIFAKAVRTG